MNRDGPMLSSNWKQLQQKIKSQPSQSRAPAANGVVHLKRKADKSAFDDASKPAKKARKDSRPVKKAMGSYVSSYVDPSVDKPKQPSSKPATTPSVESGALDKTQDAARAVKYIAVDCEMVGTMTHTPCAIKSRKDAPDFSILARVSIVTFAQDVLYDTYVLPPYNVRVSDYRTQYSGITAWHLNANNQTTKPKSFEQVQEEVSKLLEGRILVGHAVNNDLAVLGLSHPKRHTRDTARYLPFRELAATTRRDGMPGKGRTPALKMLAERLLGWDIQSDEHKGHSSVEDAKATMALFQRDKAGIEREAIKIFGRSAVEVGRKPTKSVDAAAPKDSPIDEPSDESDAESKLGADDTAQDVDSEDDSSVDLDALEQIGSPTSAQPAKPTRRPMQLKQKKKKKRKGQYRR